jgi:putative N6-adenine-specific DNA methylase
MTDLDAYAVCAPGLESLVADELAGLGLTVTGTEHGGVAFTTDLTGVYRANLCSRLATRILLRLATFRARSFPGLAGATADLPWESYLTPGTPVVVKAASRASRLYVLKRIAATVTEAITGRVGPAATTADTPHQQVLVRLVHNQCTLSLDTSGELLHRRGYRLATAKAPLRETLACAVLSLCGWRPATPLLDPFCGAGTFAIEAARWGLDIPPGWDRTFACQSWPSCDRHGWEAVRDQAAAARRATLPSPITASDRDPGSVRMARDNAARAGVADLLTIEAGDFFDLRPDGPPGLVAINAPYGRRIRESDLRAVYRRLGHHLHDRYRGWRYALLCGNATLARATGLAPDRRHSLLHGGRRVPLLHGRL